MAPGAVRAPFPPAALWAAHVLLAAGFETLQCAGLVSPRDSSCHVAAGDTTCPREDGFQVQGYTFSEPFHLIVSYDWLVLQGPAAPVFEGDPLLLRCQAWQDWPLAQVTFYRDGSALGPPGPDRQFPIAAAREADSGRYHCGAVFRSPRPGSPEEASPVAITVQELFPAPVLRATPSAKAHEGHVVTLSCQTQLAPQRSAARLLFSFHKDEGTVRGWGPSPELQVPVASEAHAGSYWCEAATEDSHVRKQSPRLEVGVQGPPSSAAPRTSSPAPQGPAAPGPPPVGAPGPLPAPPAPDAEAPGCHCPPQAPDPHLHHRVGLLLQQVQDMRVLLGHLLVELRHLSGRPEPQTPEGPAQDA